MQTHALLEMSQSLSFLALQLRLRRDSIEAGEALDAAALARAIDDLLIVALAAGELMQSWRFAPRC